PIPGKGLRCMLIEQVFCVLHIDEFKTSKWCPYCGEGQIKKFLDVDNPQPHRRAETPVIKSHAVLRFNNGKCEGWVVNSTTGDEVERIINRNFSVCLNFRRIVDGLWEHGSIPKHIIHPRCAGNFLEVAPDDGPPTRRQQTE
ncbi:hypothetical protein COEREDRAFT_39860, partial [Coemansia reversa NRRL 1564]